MCNCINEIREVIKTDTTIASVVFSLSNIVSISNEKERITKTGQEVIIGYQKISKAGISSMRYKKSFVTHNYCPFCGKEYVEIPTE